ILKEYYPSDLDKDKLILFLSQLKKLNLDVKELDEILNKLDIKSFLDNEAQKEDLIKSSISHSSTNGFFDYFLNKELYESFASGVIQHMIEEASYSKMLALTKFMKRSIDVEILLTSMHKQYEVEKQKQQEIAGCVLPDCNIMSYFIQCQLQCGEENSIGENV